METQQGRAAGLGVVLLAAAGYALMNALKPLHIDDPFTRWVSEQILAAPLDPFGFEIFWYQWPQPCSEDLLAPVVGYWGAFGLLLAGESDFLWKLSLFPLAALFAVAFHALARRFATGLETPLTLLTLFSPALLPSMNYMQDVPALAFGLAALALYLRGEERGSLGLAIAAGLLAGVAMQTKYTAFGIPAAMALHALLFRRLRFGIAAGLAAGFVFVAWEAYATRLYGAGMFAGNLAQPVFWSPRALLVVPLVQLLGATLGVMALLGLAALGLPRAAVLGLAAALLVGHAALLVGPHARALYLASGAVVIAALAAVALDRLRRGDGAPVAGGRLVRRRPELFLLAWLLVELVGYFQISLFAAVRRVLPLLVPATLLLGRSAALAAGPRWIPLLPLAALQVALGFAYFGVDLIEARAQRDAAREAFRAIRARDSAGDVWFTGHWGFQWYAEALGMRPLVPDYSEVRAGDWVVLPTRVDQQVVELDPAVFELVQTRSVPAVPPLFSSYGFYAGGTPLEHASGPRIETHVFRARTSSVPPSGWRLQQVAEWALAARGEQAGWARRALARELGRHPRPDGRRLAARALGELGPLAAEAAPDLARAAQTDPDPAVRRAAAAALARVHPAP